MSQRDTEVRTSRRVWIAAYVLIGVAAVLRVAATHRVFSEVLDEPAHISSGYDWLKGVPYTIDPTHPPLERILSAIPALLQHVPLLTDPNFIARGNSILYFQNRYERNLSRARLGNLLFLIIGMASVAAWATRLFGRRAGLLAMAIYSSIPAILGHAGVATTDMAVAGMFPLAIVLFERWLDAPVTRRSIALGLGAGLAMLSKFSFLVFFPVAAVVVVALRWWSARRGRTIGAVAPRVGARFTAGTVTAAIVALVVVWAGYRFDFQTMRKAFEPSARLVETVAPAPLRPLARWWAENVPMPAPLYAAGFAMVRDHDLAGHETYLLGRHSSHGWWYYFPVVFFYKTPIPLLILITVGAVALIARAKRSRDPIVLAPLMIAVGVMLVVMPSSINIGIRHILPIYAPLAVVAAYGCIAAWRMGAGMQPAPLAHYSQAAVVAMLAWLFVGGAAAHPDYLAWFNGLAGTHPEEIVVDSNLDWGQDVLRLARTARRMHIESMWILYTGNALLERHGLVAPAIQPWMPAPGWYVLSETALKLNPDARRGAYKWLDAYSMRRVGKSMRLYHVPQCP